MSNRIIEGFDACRYPVTATSLSRTAPLSEASARLVRTLATAVLLQWLGATAIVPMLPVYIRRLGGTDALAGLVMASFYASGVVSQYPIGRLADRIGHRQVLVAGLVMYGVASFSFLLPIGAVDTVVLRSTQGVGAGASTVAALAMISRSVPAERRGRAFATIYSAELTGMAIGPLVGSVLGVHMMWVLFLAAGTLSLLACLPALFVREPMTINPPARSADGLQHKPTPVIPGAHPGGWLKMEASAAGALICAGILGLTTGIYDICWTLLLLDRGASGFAIGISWTLFAAPFVLAARPSGWLADHLDRRVLAIAGLSLSTVLCATYPFLHSVPLLVALGGSEALGFAAALPAIQSMLTEGIAPSAAGRIQGVFGTVQTAFTAGSAAFAGAAFALAIWLPFVSVSATVAVALFAVGLVWRTASGLVHTRGPAQSSTAGALTGPVLTQTPEVVATGATEPFHDL